MRRPFAIIFEMFASGLIGWADAFALALDHMDHFDPSLVARCQEAKVLSDVRQVSGSQNSHVAADGKYLIFAVPRLKPYWLENSFLDGPRKMALRALH